MGRRAAFRAANALTATDDVRLYQFSDQSEARLTCHLVINSNLLNRRLKSFPYQDNEVGWIFFADF